MNEARQRVARWIVLAGAVITAIGAAGVLGWTLDVYASFGSADAFLASIALQFTFAVVLVGAYWLLASNVSPRTGGSLGLRAALVLLGVGGVVLAGSQIASAVQYLGASPVLPTALRWVGGSYACLALGNLVLAGGFITLGTAVLSSPRAPGAALPYAAPPPWTGGEGGVGPVVGDATSPSPSHAPIAPTG